MTRVYLCCGQGRLLPASAAELLPPWRRERYDRLRREKPRQESLRAGLLYAYALKQWGMEPAEPVTMLPAGKPVFQQQDIFFSLSHSGDWAMCALSHHPIGVDIQHVRPVKRTMARRFHPRERQWLEALSEDVWETEFFRLWTRKEAWVKAESEEKMLSLSAEDVIHPSDDLWHFQDYPLPGGYHAAVCALEKNTCEPVMVEETELLAGLF